MLVLLFITISLLGIVLPTVVGDTTGIDQAWVCVGAGNSSKVYLSTATPNTGVTVTNLDSGMSNSIVTDSKGNFSGRFPSFASAGNTISFQLTGQPVPSKTRVAGACTISGAGAILIHEFADTDTEMTAFQAGSLDLVDWPVPKATIDQWTNCNGPVAIVENCFNPTTNQRAQVTLSTNVDLGMFQYDLNNYVFPTSNLAFRQALGYLADRQQIALGYAGGDAVPICAGTAAQQPGAKDCLKLGYPSSYGEYNPQKALQILNEAGFVDTNGDGILELTPGVNAPAITMVIRVDDPIRTQAGQLLKNALENLPKSYTSSSTVTVCPSTPMCKFTVNPMVVDRRVASSIVFRSPWDDWSIYTGGWGLGLDPDHLQQLYGSEFAPAACGGGWPSDFPLNYPCYVDATYDTKAQPLVTGKTYADVLAAAGSTQDYAWGYNTATHKIKGTMPTVPLYTFLATRAAWKKDEGDFPLMADGTVGTSSSSQLLRSCWRGMVAQSVGTGLSNTATLKDLYLDNCSTTNASYRSYRGDSRAVLDWGFKSTIQKLNIVTSQWLWDQLTMQLTYDSMLDRNPVDLQTIVPALAQSFGASTYLNQALSKEATVAYYKLRGGVLWNDGVPLTSDDVRFSIEYVKQNLGWNFPFVEHVLRVDLEDTLGLAVYFDDTGALFMQNVGFLPIIPKHVWCPSWPDTTTNCPYPNPDLFPDFDFAKHVGTGSYMITSCTGVNCSETITLRPNPYYLEGNHYWSLPAEIGLQPDLNGDDHINSQDMQMVSDAMGSIDPLVDVDYRIVNLGTQSFPNALGTGSVTITTQGAKVDSTDLYIVQRLMSETSDPAGILWPPRGVTYTWPDTSRDNVVDVDDLLNVYLHQFQDPKAISPNSINDVDYNGDISLDDLIIAFLNQFTKPPGAT